MLRDLILANRSYRRFAENVAVDRQVLEELVDLARLTPSGANRQPLKYLLSWTPERNELVFPCLAWAGYLTDWPGPDAGERPTAYIIVLGDTRRAPAFGCDHGIAAQTILLGAVERGLGGCIVGSIDRDRLRTELRIEPHLEILLVLAIGKPAEKVVLETVGDDGSIKYWRDAAGVHHVPKRRLADVIVG